MKKILIGLTMFVSLTSVAAHEEALNIKDSSFEGEVYVGDLDIVCVDQNDVIQLDLMESVLKFENSVFKVRSRSYEHTAKMMYNGNFYKTKYPVVDLVLENSNRELKLAYFAEHGSKNVNYGRVEITQNGQVTHFQNCTNIGRIY